MSNKGQPGFTLIEVILVMAISSALLVVAFAGQRGIRSRAQFDAAVNKFVATVSDARNQSTAGVNIIGGGDGSTSCPGGPGGQYVFSGIAWTADDSLSPSPLKMDYYKAVPGSVACIFQTQTISLPTQVSVNATNPVATRGGRMLFVRDDRGGLQMCSVANLSTVNPASSFQAGACTGGASMATLTLNLTDADGHSSQVTIDQSGLARRMN